MCLHFGLVATDVLDKISLAKHFVFVSMGQDQKFSLSLSHLSGKLVPKWGVWRAGGE